MFISTDYVLSPAPWPCPENCLQNYCQNNMQATSFPFPLPAATPSAFLSSFEQVDKIMSQCYSHVCSLYSHTILPYRKFSIVMDHLPKLLPTVERKMHFPSIFPACSLYSLLDSRRRRRQGYLVAYSKRLL